MCISCREFIVDVHNHDRAVSRNSGEVSSFHTTLCGQASQRDSVRICYVLGRQDAPSCGPRNRAGSLCPPHPVRRCRPFRAAAAAANDGRGLRGEHCRAGGGVRTAFAGTPPQAETVRHLRASSGGVVFLAGGGLPALRHARPNHFPTTPHVPVRNLHRKRLDLMPNEPEVQELTGSS